MIHLTHDEAQAIYNRGEWQAWDDAKLVRFQLQRDRLCVDWIRFASALNRALGRRVAANEFAGDAGKARLEAEYNQKGLGFFDTVFGES